MKYIKTLKIDIDKKNFEVIPSVQYDSNTRFLHIQLLNDSVPFDITGCSVILSGVKEDGNPIFNSCDIINSEIGFIQAEVTEQMNAIPGNIDCEIKIYDGEGVLTSKKFTIKVTASQTSRSVVSSNEFKALTDALNKVQAIDNKAEKAEVEKLSSQLETKANKIDVNSKIWSMANMGQDIKEAMTNGSVAVVGENSVLRENIVKGQVTTDRTNFIQEFGNIFDKHTCTDGKKINANGSISDVEGYWISDKIPYIGEELFTQGVIYYLRYDHKGKVLGTQKPSENYPCSSFIVCGNGSKDNVIVSFRSLSKETKYTKIQNLKYDVVSERDIKDNSITIDKVNFIKKGKNLFNKESETIKDGVTFNNNTGIQSIDSKKFIEEIKINPNLQITISGSLGTWQFNNEKGERISGANFFTDSVTLTPPSGAFTLKVALLIEKKNSIQIEYGSSQTLYEDFYYDIPKLKTPTSFNNSEITIEKSINLFNPFSENIIKGKNFASSGGIQNYDGWFISDYIEIDNSVKYVIKNINIKGSALWGYYQTYDKTKKVVTKRNKFDGNAEFNFTSDEKYIRITTSLIYCTETGYNKLIFGKSDEVKGFVKYGDIINSLNLGKNNIQPNFYNWYGKKMCCYGDSNTGNKMWQQYVIDKFGLEYFHKGIGGTTSIGRCSDEELNKLPRDLSLFILNFGTNDVNQGVPVGELPAWGIDYTYEFDTTTYIGALCKIVRYISVNIPECRIIIMSPLYRSNSKLNQTSNEYPNFYKYIQACKDIADRFGCEFIDLYSDLGINLWNYQNYFLDESANKDGDCWSVHLNELGGKRVGAIVSKTIENLEPII